MGENPIYIVAKTTGQDGAELGASVLCDDSILKFLSCVDPCKYGQRRPLFWRARPPAGFPVVHVLRSESEVAREGRLAPRFEGCVIDQLWEFHSTGPKKWVCSHRLPKIGDDGPKGPLCKRRACIG